MQMKSLASCETIRVNKGIKQEECVKFNGGMVDSKYIWARADTRRYKYLMKLYIYSLSDVMILIVVLAIVLWVHKGIKALIVSSMQWKWCAYSHIISYHNHYQLYLFFDQKTVVTGAGDGACYVTCQR